ncbi:MAG: TonB-dependent receptor, partial [Pseudomonadota bacterium]
MKTRNTLALVAASLAVPALSVAQDAEPVDQIVVTAARTPIEISRVASAITVIDRDAIERREARNVAELLRSVPGFAVSQTGVTGTQTQIRLRGAEANHLLVLVDGVRATDPATSDEFRWEFLSTASIERIEIVRGAQSALWGSDAIAGVVNIITRGASGDSEYGGFAEAGSFGSLNGGFNASIGDERWSLGGGIETQSTDGENISRTGSEDDDSDLTTLNVKASFAASDEVSLFGSLRHVDATSQFDPVDFAVTGLPTDGDNETETSNTFAAFGVDIDGGNLQHTLRIDLYSSDNDNFVDGTFDSSASSDRTTFRYQTELAINENRLIFAAEHEQTDYEQRGEVSFGDPNQDQDIDATGIVLEYQGLSAERFTWIASARFDSNSDFDDALDGRLSATYDVSDATTLRASAATGRKNPTFTERFGFFPGLFLGNPDLEPESSVTYELGLGHSFADGAANIDVAIFKQDLEDEINGFVFDPVTFLTTAENRSGTSRRDGVEVSGNWMASDSLDLGFHYTYTDATDDTAREVRRPKHAGGLSASLSGLDQRLQTTLNADYGGTRLDTFFPPFPNPSEVVTLDAYWLVDLAVHYRVNDKLRVFARGTNLLDDDYEQVFGYQTLGRAVFAGV